MIDEEKDITETEDLDQEIDEIEEVEEESEDSDEEIEEVEEESEDSEDEDADDEESEEDADDADDEESEEGADDEESEEDADDTDKEQAVVATQKEENSTMGILSIVFGVLVPIAGFILALIGLKKYKKDSNKKLCKIGLGLSIGFFIFSLFSNLISFVSIIATIVASGII